MRSPPCAMRSSFPYALCSLPSALCSFLLPPAPCPLLPAPLPFSVSPRALATCALLYWDPSLCALLYALCDFSSNFRGSNRFLILV
jgi:hypothetical protein